MNFFNFKRNIYRRFYSYGVEEDDSDDSDGEENSTRIDEIIVHPNTPTEESTSSIEAKSNVFYPVENLLIYMNSLEVKKLLKRTTKIFFFKLQINDASNKPNSEDLEKLGHCCANNSIVIILMTKNGKNFFLYWKSKKLKYFLMFKIYSGSSFMNDLKFFEFMGKFLAESLKQGHLGLVSCVSTHPRLNTFELHLLADHRNYNLLLIAAELGDDYIVNLTLNCNCSTESGGTNAQTLAWTNRHFEVLLTLLKTNLTYPESFNIGECPNDIKEFYEISQKLNEAMTLKNEQLVLDILSKNTEMRHFYNSNNESAVAFAIKRKLFTMYSLLISKNIILGPHEKFSEIKDELKESEKEKLREIHYNESKFLPDNHMHVLLSNSRLGHNTSDAKMKYDIIQKAFELLNQNPFIQIILIIVAASRNFRIIFDFNRESVEVVDPTADESTRGEFYPSGRIYIGAANLMNPEKKFKNLGTLAHELCHYAMSLVYGNNAKPYSDGDTKSERQFEEILKICKEKIGKEKIIDLVHNYPPFMHHAELIVRVPHLIMKYFDNLEKFQAVREIFNLLFDVFEEKIFPEMKKALPRIERNSEVEVEKNKKRIRKFKIVSIIIGILSVIAIIIVIFVTRTILFKPTYEYSNLPYEDKIKIENAPVIYKKVDVKFHDLFRRNSSAYYKLTSDHITQMLNGDPLNFSDTHLLYLDKMVQFKWGNLTTKLKNKFLNMNCVFQNESLELKTLFNKSAEAFDSLTSPQILNVLDEKDLIINSMIQNKTQFYLGRPLFDEHLFEIYFWYLYTRTKLYYDDYCMFEATPETFQVKFEDFYKNFTNQVLEDQLQIISKIRDKRRFKLCSVLEMRIYKPITHKVIDTLFFHRKLQFSLERVLREINESRIFILSAEPGAGKTTLLQQYAMQIKKKFPSNWIAYLDCRDHLKFYKKFSSMKELLDMLKNILGLSSKNKFEMKIFEKLFKSGNIIFFWDSFDQIPSNYRKIVGDFFPFIKNHTKNIQFLSTRPLYSDFLISNLKIKTFTLVPLYRKARGQFLYEFFLNKKLDKVRIPNYVNKALKIANSVNERETFRTPLLLGMVADLISSYADIYKSENLYEIYSKFVYKKIQIWHQTSEFAKEFINTIIVTGFNMMTFYQKDAFRSDYQQFGSYLSLNLKILRQKVPKELTSDEISRMGILYTDENDNYELGHRTFCDFFIAQYFIENIYNADDEPSEQEAELRLRLLHKYSSWDGVKKFITHYLMTISRNETKKFDPMIDNLLRSKYRNFFFNALLQTGEPFPFLFEFFKKDNDLLKYLLHLDQNESFYAKTFDFTALSIYNLQKIKRSDIDKFGKKNLKPEEYQKFIDVKDKKGLILYSMYYFNCISKNLKFTRYHYMGYDLDDDILNSDDVYFALESIVNISTSDEIKVLLGSKLIFHPIQKESPYDKKLYIVENDEIFFDKVWKLAKLYLTKNEKKTWISNSLEYIFFTRSEPTRYFLIDKFKTLFSNDEIYEMFINKGILHLTASICNNETNFQRFNSSWNFFVNHTNPMQQKNYLQNKAEMECYMNEFYNHYCYITSPLNLLQASLLEEPGIMTFRGLPSFIETKNIYSIYLKNSELQQIIVSGSKDFIPLLVLLYPLENCKAYSDLLKQVFHGSENVLKNFLESEVEHTRMNIFDLLRKYDENHQDCIKLFSDLLNI